MIQLPANETQLTSMLVDSSNVDELRARRVWQFYNVAMFMWMFFAYFYWCQRLVVPAQICTFFLASYVVGLVFARKCEKYRRIMHLNLALSGSGMVVSSLCDPAMADTILYFPLSIIIASQLIGVRDAFGWLILSLVAILTVHVGLDGFGTTVGINQFALRCGVAVCIFMCCQQAEVFFKARTKGLMELSLRLRTRSEEFQRLASTDSLTGLINRFQFQKELQISIEAASESNPMALLLIDMDGFKDVNDTLGHAVGDRALIEIGRRLNQKFGERAKVARLGGDEFCIVIPDVQSTDEVAKLAAEAHEVLVERYKLAETEFGLGASIGFAICPNHTKSQGELLSFADTAMFHAKENRIPSACYETSMTDRLVEHLEMNEKLAGALEGDEFFLVYQPQVCLHSGEIVGVEALLRWKSGGEFVSPGRFIPYLEASREIIHVGKWVIHEACRQQAKWKSQGFDVEISVNVSPVQFNDNDFISSMIASLEEFDVAPDKLDIEITEGLLCENVEQAVSRLNDVKELGASISIDDFGTGYSSLAYLRQFPLDRLKIDRSFIKDIPNSDDGVIASSIVELSKALGLKVIAEGVETIEQREFLKQHDCDQYQGYCFSRPIRPDEITERFLNDAVDEFRVAKSKIAWRVPCEGTRTEISPLPARR